MNPRTENPSFDTIVREALEKMKDATSAAASYQIDRTSGQWTVRRALKATDRSFSAEMIEKLALPGGS